MKTPAIALSFLLLSSAGAPLAAQNTDTPDPKALIEQLGDPEFAVRKAAEEKLMKIGKAALKPLRESAETHSDPEVKWRAGRLARRIQDGTVPSRGLARRERDGSEPARGGASKRRRVLDATRPFEEVFESLERGLSRGGVDDEVRKEIERAMERLRVTQRDLAQRFDFGPYAGSGFGWNFGRDLVPDFDRQGARSGQGRSLKMSSGPDGVRVEVTETDKDGNQERKVYEAEDMQSFKKKYPGVLDGDGVKLHVGRPFGVAPFRIEGLREGPDGRGWRRLLPRTRPDADAEGRDPVAVEPGRSEGRKLGFYYAEVAPAVRQYLGLSDGAGLMVESVAAGSLAEKLRLQQGDIVVRVGNTRISSAADVSRGLEGIADGELRVEVIRRGREMELRSGHELPGEAKDDAQPQPKSQPKLWPKSQPKAEAEQKRQSGKLHPR